MSVVVGLDYVSAEMKKKVLSFLPESVHALEQLRNKTCKGSEYTGWLDWPKHEGFQLLNQIEKEFQNHLAPFDLVVVIGIGGSYAGVKAVVDALNPDSRGLSKNRLNQKFVPITYAGHNLSETELLELLEVLDSYQPLLIVISKSGTTTEPAIGFRFLREALEKKFGKEDACRRIIAITDGKKGVLRQLAEESGYKVFPIPDDVGGRFSVLTSVGLVPLVYGKYDCWNLLHGAEEFFKSLSNLDQHPALLLACLRKAAWEMGKKIDIFSYGEPKLSGMVEWWKQLFGESEGKEGKGLFPASMVYSTDLHSVGQYLQEGAPTILETFFYIKESGKKDLKGVEKRLPIPHSSAKDGLDYLTGVYLGEVNTKAMRSAQKAHFEKAGMPCVDLTIPRLDEYHLGYLFGFFETVCGVSALMLGVNPFDQPGVEEYKKNMFALLGKPTR